MKRFIYVVKEVYEASIDGVLSIIHDNADELGILTIAYAVSYLDIISSFLVQNGWDKNHFLLGTLGQLVYILLAYVKRKVQGKFSLYKASKNLVSLFLGGFIAMMLLPLAPFERALLVSAAGVGIGFTYEWVWRRFIAKRIETLFADSEADSIQKLDDDGGEDRPNGDPR